MNMRLISLIIVLVVSLSSYSQVNGSKIEKLKKLYDGGKYESCLYRADNLTYKEEFQSDPEPLLYMSMCFYNLSNSTDPYIKEDYADGLKESMRYASKFASKDKKDILYTKNIDFINKLKEVEKESIVKALSSKRYSKASSSAKSYNKLNREENQTVKYMIGVYYVLGNNASQGQKYIDEAYEKLTTEAASGKVDVEQILKTQVVDSFLKYSEYLVSENKITEAKKQLDLAKKIFPSDGYINMQHKMVSKAAGN